MRVAICLFRQPRKYNGGYSCIKKFMDKHSQKDLIIKDLYLNNYFNRFAHIGQFFDSGK